MKDVEGWGGGVSRYFEKGEELGLPSPKVEELEGGFFRVTFYRNSRAGIGRNESNEDNREDNEDNRDDNRDDNDDNQLMVLDAIGHDPHLTVRQLAARLPISKATVERVLKALQSKGELRRVGGTRGSWKVLK